MVEKSGVVVLEVDDVVEDDEDEDTADEGRADRPPCRPWLMVTTG